MMIGSGWQAILLVLTFSLNRALGTLVLLIIPESDRLKASSFGYFLEELMAAWLQLFSTFVIGAIGVYVAVQQYKLNQRLYVLGKQKRSDELFDRRYEFVKELRSWWHTTHPGHPQYSPHDVTDLFGLAQEAEILFGSDVSDFVLSLGDKEYDGNPVDDGFIPEVIAKHLKFETNQN